MDAGMELPQQYSGEQADPIAHDIVDPGASLMGCTVEAHNEGDDKPQGAQNPTGPWRPPFEEARFFDFNKKFNQQNRDAKPGDGIEHRSIIAKRSCRDSSVGILQYLQV
jgi:hypothetical protein